MSGSKQTKINNFKWLIILTSVIILVGLGVFTYLQFQLTSSIEAETKEKYTELYREGIELDPEFNTFRGIQTCDVHLLSTEAYTIHWINYVFDEGEFSSRSPEGGIFKIRRESIYSSNWEYEQKGKAIFTGHTWEELQRLNLDCEELLVEGEKEGIKWSVSQPLSDSQKEAIEKAAERERNRTLPEHYLLELSYLPQFGEAFPHFVEERSDLTLNELWDLFEEERANMETGELPSPRIVNYYESIIGQSLFDAVEEQLKERDLWTDEFAEQNEEYKNLLVDNFSN